ncbi:hypothetical protein P3W85_19570 [Cupriavidus basilensis]|uniref:Uncharacterized protein n=1 Tax=Cupriavidus basilensis TaxID=68895 RepID=A0ABT6ARB9_9BURK|nr:hypothetical protein [Cupriavidus basilensis]MDF3835143.1 hypothetical protein [Cupriavidus basilensis]
MTITKSLRLQANTLAATLDGTPGALLALAHAGYRQWTKARHLNFPPARREELLQEILHFCADTHLLKCPPEDECRPQAIADMLDARYPRYARHRASSHRKRLYSLLFVSPPLPWERMPPRRGGKVLGAWFSVYKYWHGQI